jgi:hypothetical protein
MADNWTFVFAAYGLAAFALGAYWRRLARREREIREAAAARARARATEPRAARAAHPRPDAASRSPVQ